MVVLGYYEMPEIDQPDRLIWAHAEALEEHFEAVRLRHEHPDSVQVEDVEEDTGKTVRNELYDQYLREAKA